LKKWIKRFVLSFTLVLLFSAPIINHASSFGESWLSGWSDRIKITIDHTKISSSLSNFPILLHISRSSGIGSDDVSAVFDEMTSDTNRKKIAVTTSDGTTQCYVEISYWSDVNEQAALWVKVPSISNSVDTILYLYYDNTQVDNINYVGDTGSAPAQKVWDSNYVAVWHLVESGNGTTGEYKDSTSHGNNGTGGNGVAQRSPTRVINELGLPVQSFAGDGDNKSSYIQIPDADGFSIPIPGGFTVEGSISPNKSSFGGTSHYTPWIVKANQNSEKEWEAVIYDTTGLGEGRVGWNNWYISDPTKNFSSGADQRDPTPVGSWANIAGTTTSTNSQNGHIVIYKNGLVGSTDGEWIDESITYQPSHAPIKIGCWEVNNKQFWFPGRISEVRISKTVRSGAWLLANNYSLKDNLLSYGVNQPPVLAAIGNKTVNEGAFLTFTITGTDPDGDTLTYSASNLPSGATFNATTRTFSWRPSYRQAGNYPEVHFEVTDGGLIASENIIITANQDLPLIIKLIGIIIILLPITVISLLVLWTIRRSYR
jgi:hypothetical protein